jgi:hypothetical protein
MMGANYDAEEEDFLRAMDRWQRSAGVKFPTFTQVLMVAKSLGYRRVAAPAGRGRRRKGA